MLPTLRTGSSEVSGIDTERHIERQRETDRQTGLDTEPYSAIVKPPPSGWRDNPDRSELRPAKRSSPLSRRLLFPPFPPGPLTPQS
ncbi:hypothetical protein RRG08_052372 [Elysia crispata]|uniref:Uncharacterized protein n=1 Tax=Elysia crispata TaxID=231223 RepID=A0AAE1A6B6_9GAST|nr:hypothetical protein RRG08_052372 [Elysia crispata]